MMACRNNTLQAQPDIQREFQVKLNKAGPAPLLARWGTAHSNAHLCKVHSSGKRRWWSESRSVLSFRPHGLYSPWNSSAQNTRVGSCSLLQGIVPTQGSNSGLLNCRHILYELCHKRSPRILEWVAYPFSRGSSRPRNQTGVSCIAGGFFTPTDLSRKPHTCQEPGTRLRVFPRKMGPAWCSGTGKLQRELRVKTKTKKKSF